MDVVIVIILMLFIGFLVGSVLSFSFRHSYMRAKLESRSKSEEDWRVMQRTIDDYWSFLRKK